MSVYRQLIIVISTVILLLVLLWTAIGIQVNRNSMIEQMEVQARGGATSLAIAMTEVLKENDRSRLNLLFNAVFDLGFYQQIYFVDLDNNKLIERTLAKKNPRAPQLFIQLLKLPNVEASAAVNSGWRRIGDVVVVMESEEKYHQLWQSSLRKGLWNLSAAAVAILLTAPIIRLRLKSAQRSGKRG